MELKSPEVAALRDGLIAELDGAVKFQPMLDSMAMEELENLVITKGDSPEAIEVMVTEKVLARRDEMLTLAQAEHAKFIAKLRDEIANDPDQCGYAGMSDEQIADAMMREVEVTESRTGPSEMEGIVADVTGSLAYNQGGFLVTKDGNVLDQAGLQALIDAKVADSKKPVEELKTPSERTVVVRVKQAPCWRVIAGVKYGRNIVRAKEITEARS